MPHSEDLKPVEWVDTVTIQDYFNDHILPLINKGTLVPRIKESKVPRRTPDGEPEGTKTEMIYYCRQDGTPVALIHQYLRPDGTIGASGKPDPKVIFLKDKTMKLRAK